MKGRPRIQTPVDSRVCAVHHHFVVKTRQCVLGTIMT